ncbi:OsmC family protein [Cocleimonas sp. KMM 6892]|uniref:OsmC family protein n=1 Tax=unclassified Cocleimonas TaxID=2639732 RepID=UPI002DBE9E3F|nr:MULTISPECIES: OsmC family protein [unclassified Cocleimonas]MEB8431235.1 OsmC family protein [Cocleimonas sp. KMM 6892]MEC4713993.1 OsmC family protein [Cocleimonas sp. KMM 6895]MEC4743324.1 OsmC family protein [Cocleimonas sp. KMM 6896]
MNNASHYNATVVWQRGSQTFSDNKYSRAHQWVFDSGTSIAASSSPHIVPLPYSVDENIDPEEAFVASLSSCHMLFFLSFAAKNKWIIDSYEDSASGTLEKNEEGKLAMTKVVLNPEIKYSGETPSKEQEAEIHHLAHEACFIANSVKTVVEIK